MLKKPITYTNYNDRVVTEDFYFNLSMAELTRMEIELLEINEDMETTTGGLQEFMQAAIDSRKGDRIIAIFDMVIDKSFGVKSEDGKHFQKNPFLLEDFKSTAAYDALFLELVTDAEAASQFLNGVMPTNLNELAEKSAAQEQLPIGLRAAEVVNPLSREFFDGPPAPNVVAENKAAFEAEASPDAAKIEPSKRRDRTKAEILEDYRQKKVLARYRLMSEAEAMQLPEDEFYKWVDAQPEATPAQ